MAAQALRSIACDVMWCVLQLAPRGEPQHTDDQTDDDLASEGRTMRACEVIISDKLMLPRDATHIKHDNATFIVYTGALNPEARTMIVAPRLREMHTITNEELNHWCQMIVDTFTGKRRAHPEQSGFPGTGGQLSTTRRASLRPGSLKDPSNTGGR